MVSKIFAYLFFAVLVGCSATTNDQCDQWHKLGSKELGKPKSVEYIKDAGGCSATSEYTIVHFENDTIWLTLIHSVDYSKSSRVDLYKNSDSSKFKRCVCTDMEPFFTEESCYCDNVYTGERGVLK